MPSSPLLKKMRKISGSRFAVVLLRMSHPRWQLIHATALCLGGIGFLLMGKSRSGKSDFALRLIMEEGARLVGDDACEVAWCYGGAFVRGTPSLSGILEVRPWGPTRLAREQIIPRAKLGFVCTLDDSAPFAPDLHHKGIDVPVYPVAPFERAASAKLRLLVQGVQGLSSPEPLCLDFPKRVKPPL
ncbi:MAG: HPr kinase/phosphorylase [Alphaproteobacteria bacterium]